MDYKIIKEKYNKPQMSDETAKKINQLEVAYKVLIIGTYVVGAITVIDIFTPDPIFMLDEAALAAITGFLKTASTFAKKKIALLVETDNAKISSKDVEELSKDVTNVAKNIKRSRTSKK
jgi:hypothetical protein